MKSDDDGDDSSSSDDKDISSSSSSSSDSDDSSDSKDEDIPLKQLTDSKKDSADAKGDGDKDCGRSTDSASGSTEGGTQQSSPPVVLKPAVSASRPRKVKPIKLKMKRPVLKYPGPGRPRKDPNEPRRPRGRPPKNPPLHAALKKAAKAAKNNSTQKAAPKPVAPIKEKSSAGPGRPPAAQPTVPPVRIQLTLPHGHRLATASAAATASKRKQKDEALTPASQTQAHTPSPTATPEFEASSPKQKKEDEVPGTNGEHESAAQPGEVAELGKEEGPGGEAVNEPSVAEEPPQPVPEVRAFWRPPPETKPLLDQVLITDVTSADVTVTVRESSTDNGFFKHRGEDWL